MTGWRLGYAGRPDVIIKAMSTVQASQLRISSVRRWRQWPRSADLTTSSKSTIKFSGSTRPGCQHAEPGDRTQFDTEGAFYVYPNAGATAKPPRWKHYLNDEDFIRSAELKGGGLWRCIV